MTCEKCGSGDIHTSYHRSDAACSFDSHARRFRMGEHLHRTCRGCGFDWTTKTLASLSVSVKDNG